MNRKPKNYNRVMLINIGTPDAKKWKKIAEGILSRANNINENAETYYYISGQGTSEKEVTSQDVGVSFTGHRTVGDEAQDYILDAVLFYLDSREIEFMDFDDIIDVSGEKPPVNGFRGTASIQITDFGSGDAASRQNIGFTLNFKGKPERGTVTKTGDVYTFIPKA